MNRSILLGSTITIFILILFSLFSIQNITLEYTLSVETEGTVKYIFNREEVDLSESFAGVIQPKHAIPFTVPVTPEGKELLQLMTEENKTLKIENVKFGLEK